MRQSGFSAAYAEARLREYDQNPTVKGARKAVAIQRKAADILDALSKLEHKSPFTKQVDAVQNLPAASFYRDYFFRNRPVVLRGDDLQLDGRRALDTRVFRQPLR
jgi:hypothetical protein